MKKDIPKFAKESKEQRKARVNEEAGRYHERIVRSKKTYDRKRSKSDERRQSHDYDQ